MVHGHDDMVRMRDQSLHGPRLPVAAPRIHGANFLFISAAVIFACAGSAHAQDEARPAAAGALKEVTVEQPLTPPPEIGRLMAQLDAADFGERNEATRRLALKGAEAIPFLVAALGDESREVRFRVKEVLGRNFSFDDLAPYLVNAIPTSYGMVARTILRDRALLQIEEASQLQFAKKLFQFWGTDVDAYRRHVMFDLVDTRTREDAARFAEPLIGLGDKARRFEEALAQLESLSLQYDHRHSSGYVVAETLAAGLRDNDADKTAFAQRFLTAFASLARQLAARGDSKGAIRKEVTERANMSDGAIVYLVRLLNTESPEYPLVAQRLGISIENLQNELFRGLAAVDAKECYVCVGKVHIVDMLAEVVESWPEMPAEGVPANLVDAVVATVATGDKPKALVLLDALEGCRDLSTHHLTINSSPGQELARRLYLSATVAANTREYYPTRSTHDRFIRLIDLGIPPDHELFPTRMYDLYLRGDINVMSDEQRTALGRYVTIVEQLRTAGLPFEPPDMKRFLTLMRQSILADHGLLAGGLKELTQVLKEHASGAADAVPQHVSHALGAWIDRQSASR